MFSKFKTITLLLIAFYVMSAFAGTGRLVDPEGNNRYMPLDIFYKTIGTKALDSDNDTLDSAGVDVWGPFSLCKDKNHPKAQWMQLIAPTACLLDGDDSLGVEYQVTASSKLVDTISANWVAWDTVTMIGKQFAPVLLDSLHGANVFFRVRSIGIDLGLLYLKHIRIMFQERMEYFTK